MELSIATGIGEARNAVVVGTADAVVAVGGEFGTLSEIALALKAGTPVIGVGSWELGRAGAPVPGIEAVDSAEEAVALALGRGRAGLAARLGPRSAPEP